MGTYGTLAIVAIAFAAIYFLKRPSITGPAARDLVKQGALLIDVRSPGEYSGGHIDGARNIPVDQIGGRIGELGAKDRPIVLYCASGARSAMAASKLKRAGFEKVFNLGSIGNW